MKRLIPTGAGRGEHRDVVDAKASPVEVALQDPEDQVAHTDGGALRERCPERQVHLEAAVVQLIPVHKLVVR